LSFTAEDIEYRHIGGQTLLAKLYRPQGKGPFPAVIGVHGGAWTSGDRNNNQAIDEPLAAAGVVVLALDFRLAPKAPYPASVADDSLKALDPNRPIREADIETTARS
jgi:acetyl esterase